MSDKRQFFKMSCEIANMSDAEIEKLAIEIFERFVGGNEYLESHDEG